MSVARVHMPFGKNAIVGMVHLRALPASPRFDEVGGIEAVEAAALADARALIAGGVEAILVENFGDVPFHADSVPPATIAAMTRIVRAIVEEAEQSEVEGKAVAAEKSVAVGVNVLRNDAAAALSIAATCGAQFIRVNVHVGSMLTDQGLIDGKAAQTLRLRKTLGCDANSENPVAILADIGVKHASPFDEKWSLESEAKDAWNRGLADALIVSGIGTGQPTEVGDLAKVKSAVRQAPLIVGSGANPNNLSQLLTYADAAIIGTALKPDGVMQERVNPILVAECVKSTNCG
jgi:membrane complex biogenesis BtpA family protein